MGKYEKKSKEKMQNENMHICENQKLFVCFYILRTGQMNSVSILKRNENVDAHMYKYSSRTNE